MSLRHIPPYDFQYRFEVDKDIAGLTLIGFYEKRFNFKSKDYWLGLMAEGEISVNGEPATPDTLLNLDDVVRTVRRDVQEPPVNPTIEILLEQDGVLVLNKPAPVPIHPSGRYYRNSLIHILEEKFPETKFHTIHRLDLWTTGVLILATDLIAARRLHKQIEKKTMTKSYGVLATGDFPDGMFTIDAAIGRVVGSQRGTGDAAQNAKASVTRFTTLLRKNGVTFLKAEPLTGRTNQIRVHIQTAGGHVLNDPMYGPTARTDIPFLGLHCRSMGFDRLPGVPMIVEAPWPHGFTTVFSADELDAAFSQIF
jgi:RluA family pseudouridine synthase